MSDLKTVEPRTVDQVHKDYSAVCANIGHLSYQIFTHTKDLEILHQQARDLNFEAAKLQAEAKAAQEVTNE